MFYLKICISHIESQNSEEVSLQESKHDKDTEKSVFSRDTFKEFTQKKVNDLLRNDNLNEIDQLRESVSKRQTEGASSKSQRSSSPSFHSKRTELEKWVTVEKDQLNKSKRSNYLGDDIFNDTTIVT